jgi:hypothetical protein
MNTKTLLISSSVFLGLLGCVLTFLPNEIITAMGITSNPISTLSLQLMGALYLGFAMLNWMVNGSLIGGVYNKPVVAGNFMHFGVGALALAKTISIVQINSEIVILITVACVIFALLFAYVFRTNPSEVKNETFYSLDLKN